MTNKFHICARLILDTHERQISVTAVNLACLSDTHYWLVCYSQNTKAGWVSIIATHNRQILINFNLIVYYTQTYHVYHTDNNKTTLLNIALAVIVKISNISNPRHSECFEGNQVHVVQFHCRIGVFVLIHNIFYNSRNNIILLRKEQI